MLFSVSPPSVVFSGFNSTVLWLIFGGLVIGVGITDTGLGNRIVSKLIVYLNGSYHRLIGGIIIMATFFAFLMPTGMGRVLLLIPIALSISDRFGFGEGSNGRTGIVLAAVLGSVLPGFAILPANIPNMVLVGMSETQCQISLLYGEYLLLHFPVFGVMKGAMIFGLILWLYPDRPRENMPEELIKTGPTSRNEVVLSLMLLILLSFWVTDSIHHIAPGWIALGGALLLMLPGVNIVNSQQLNQKINFFILFLAAGILGLGGMISHSGLGDKLANKLISSLPLGEEKPFLNYIFLSFTSTLTAIATTLAGVPAVMTPLSNKLSQVTGLPIKTVLMAQVMGFSTIIFPYQLPPIVVGMQIAGEKLSAAIKFCFILAVNTILFLFPINYLWWKILGWI